MRPCGLKLSAMNKRWLPILGMLVFSVSLHGQGSVVVFDEQQRFDVVDRYEPDGDTVSLWLSVPLSAYDGPFASLSVNYAADHYTTVSPLNRMGRVYDYAASPEDLRALTEQERFPEAFTIDLFVSKSFRLGSRYLSVSAAVNNLANRKEIVYSGYEQMRLRKSGTGLNQSITAFGSKYLYAYPRTYYLTVNFRF